jgi:2-C-methyl-D-erythritol 4-phosphate cytidylyltransferase
VTKTVDRSKLWAVQTPQAFKVDVLRKALEAADRNGLTITDEASAVEAAGGKVHLVESSVTNMKITTPDDLMMVAAVLKV